MVLYLVLIVVFGLLVLIALGLGIYALIRKKKKALITAAVLFVTGCAGCVYASYQYAAGVIAYVKSDVFQDDTRKGAALLGETVGSAASGASEGLSATLDDEAIARLGGKSSVIIGKSIKTMASGLDSTIGNKNIFTDSSLLNSGIEPGRAEEDYNEKSNDLGIYLDYNKDFKGTLRLTNYEQEGRKIDYAEQEINGKAGKGKVTTFSFLHSDLGLTTYYILSKAE